MAKKLPTKQPAQKKKKSPEAKRKELIDKAVESLQRDQAKSAGYQAIPHVLLRQPRDLPPFTFAIIHSMLIDPEIRLNLAKRAAPIMKAEFGYKDGQTWIEGVQCADPAIGQYIYRQIQRIWNLYLPAILRSQVWGWSSGEITVKLSDDGLVEIDKMLPRHASDCRLLLADKKPWGVRFARIKESDSGQGYVDLQFPYCWFHSFNAEDGDYYGVSALLGCYSPWASKWMNGGALDVRQLFMHKDAYGGVDLGYPDGETLVNGQYIPNVMIARQIVEQLAAGGVTTRPSKRDEQGNEQWPLTRASIPGNPQHILQYPKDLDAEIRSGLEVPEEDGDAWASKRVTMASFYASLDQYVVQIVCDLKEQVLDNLVLINFGHVPEYDIKHKPLAEQAMEQQSNAGPGSQQGDPNASGMDQGMSMPQQPGMPQGLPAPSPDQSTPQTMSLAGLVNKAREVIRLSVNTDVSDIGANDSPRGEYAYDYERLEVMAEIIGAIFGNEAEEMLDQILPTRMSLLSADDHPNGPNGRPVHRGSDEAYALAQNAVERAHRDRSVDSMRTLIAHLKTLSMPQLMSLRTEYDLPLPAGLREKLVDMLAESLEPEPLTMSVDKSGHEHKGKGPGGGQFTKKGGGTDTESATKKPDNLTKPNQTPVKSTPQADSTPNDKPQPIKDVPNTQVDSEPITPPPPGDAFKVDVEKTGPDGVGITARVGVPGRVVPPPPEIPKLPNLTKAERQAESDYMDAFMKDPDGMAQQYRDLIAKTDKPYTFETDQAKVLSKDWCDSDLDTQMKKRQLYNNALHQTANAIVKRAFLKHLDTLQPGDNVLVTVGGCGSGKGYTLKNTELGKNLTAEAKAVWDSAGDQNATENPWILEEAKKRGLTVTYAYVAGDPKVSWADPNRGVVKRAHDNKDGRMVDAAVFADSYVLGAKNHHAFHQANQNDPSAKFLFFSAKDQSALPGVPEESLNWDRKSLYHWAMGSIQSRTDVAPTVMRGATSGARIWNDEF